MAVAMIRPALLVGAAAAAFLGAAAGQQPGGTVMAAQPAVAHVPFGAGELAEYQVRLGRAPVGNGSMQVLGVETIDGRRTYRARLQIAGGLPLARVDNQFESWIDVERIFSRRFHQNQREINFRRNRTYQFFPERRTYRRLDNGETGTLPTDRPLDEVSFLYFVRTLPLEPGDEYEFNDYWNPDGNPVRIKVLRRETIEVPAGRFDAVVVQPLIETSGLFSEGGRAEVFFSDDDARILVALHARVVFGSIRLELREYEPGV
jgi:hypothetical protein